MAKNNRYLLAELQAGLRDDRTSTTSLLQKCILLGGQVGSECLRDWARQELKGYDKADTVPDYRRVAAAICIDGATFRGLVTGQQISPMALPEYAHGYMTEKPILTNPIGELEDLSRGSKSTVMLSPAGAQELVMLMNHESTSGDQITRLYWQVSRSTIAGIITGVRTALAELVGELLAAVSDDDQPPSKQAVDDAVQFLVTGDRNIVTVVGSQTTTNGNSTITVTGSSDQPTADKETWWRRWRKRGLLIGLATVVAAVVGVLQWIGWTP